jgi:sugar lactone lactonase YvrE
MRAQAPYVFPYDGTISTTAGSGPQGYSGDGNLATSAQLNSPLGIAVDSAGNIYFADNGNSVIRKITVSTGNILTMAGNGSAGYSGDGGQATSAELNGPCSVALDASGNLYIADTSNNVIRMVSASSGVITTVVGNGTGGFGGDGGAATSAELNQPNDVKVDGAGSVYIADSGNSRIRKVDQASGNISTIAGDGNWNFSGDGGQAASAEMEYPDALALDTSGNIYIADWFISEVRKITVSTGIISAFAGNGSFGYSGDGGPATSAALNYVESVQVDAQGNVYIADDGNNAVRFVSAAT